MLLAAPWKHSGFAVWTISVCNYNSVGEIQISGVQSIMN